MHRLANDGIIKCERLKAKHRKMALTNAELARAKQTAVAASKRLQSYVHQLVGYAGWLIRNKQYADELDALRERWIALETPRVFPVHATGHLAAEKTRKSCLRPRPTSGGSR